MPKPLTHRSCLGSSDIEWSHLISISKKLEEYKKNLRRPEKASALSLSMLSDEREKGKGREWQRVIRGAGEAKCVGGGKKNEAFCIWDLKRCVVLSKGVFSHKTP